MNLYPPGTRIANRYEVASPPHMGGMGVVYFCLDHETDLPVALKTFRPEYLPDRTVRDRFLREGTTWVGLGSHPHIVRCYAVEYIDPAAFLVLELVAKEPNYPDASLRAWLIPGKPLSVEQVLLFALQIARGMQHAADKIPGLVHRDLKPENVLVGADKLPGTQINRLRVTDFGLAHVLEGAGQSEPQPVDIDQPGRNQISEPFTRTKLTHGITGTPLYMAPEQWRGEPVGVWTDIYALGCILYEMLAGYQAASGQTLNELQTAHCAGKLRPLPASLPRRVVDIVYGCLRQARVEGYGDWAELTAALEGAYVSQAGQAPPQAGGAGELNLAERVDSGWSYNAIGASYMDMGKAEVAIEYFERSLAAGQSVGERALQGNALGNLGNAFANLGDARRAIGYHEQALAIARQNGDRSYEDNILVNLGNAYQNLGEARRAIGYYEQALAIARETGDRHSEGGTLGNMGSAYKNLGDARRAIGYHEQALAIAREISNRRSEGNCLVSLGIAYKNLGDPQRAIGYYEQALVITREIGDRRGEGIVLCNLGIAYKNLGDPRRAIVYYEQDLAITREIGDQSGEGKTMANLGLAYTMLGDPRQAIKYFEQSLAIAREAGDRRGEGIVLGNLGFAYAELREVRRAIRFCEQALEIAGEIGDINTVADNSFRMALLYTQQGDTWRALPLARQAAEIYEKTGNPSAQQARQLLAQLQGGGGHG